MSTEMNRELFKIVAYLTTSAANAFDETLALGAFRMTDAAHRLMTLIEESAELADDEFLRAAREAYHETSNLVMTDEQEFRVRLERAAREVTAECLRRSRAGEL